MRDFAESTEAMGRTWSIHFFFEVLWAQRVSIGLLSAIAEAIEVRMPRSVGQFSLRSVQSFF